MELYTRKEDCCGCGACLDVCPAGAIRMVQDREGFYYPRRNENLCTGCGKCIQVCPLKKLPENPGEHLYFGVQAKEERLRETSSSGGFFSVLARYIFQKEGVVFGAAYNENMEVIHKEAFHMEQLEALKRTKYVQSDLSTAYKRAEGWLKAGRWVLFCGTPCQIQALRLFLGTNYEKLITADLICYGVPSPGIWHSYVKYLERRYKGKMTDFSFRDKRNRDNGHTRACVIGGAEHVTSMYNDDYCTIYFSNYILRPSCHGCKFCTPERESDFTIGDFWGIEKIRPDLDDGMGNSVVILHTQRAQEVWESVRENVNWFSCEKEEVLQPRLLRPTQKAPGRKVFMKLYQTLPFALFMKLAWVMVRLRKKDS